MTNIDGELRTNKRKKKKKNIEREKEGNCHESPLRVSSNQQIGKTEEDRHIKKILRERMKWIDEDVRGE